MGYSKTSGVSTEQARPLALLFALGHKSASDFKDVAGRVSEKSSHGHGKEVT